MFFAVYCNLFRYCNWKRFVNYIYDWITSLYIDPRKGLLLLASWHFIRKLSRTAKNCFQINLRHTLLLLLCEGADDVWRLGEDVLRNLSHNIRHRVKVADHLDWCLRHVRLWTFVGWEFFEFCIPNSLAQHLPSCQSSWSPRPVLFLISLSRFHFDNKLENLWSDSILDCLDSPTDSQTEDFWVLSWIPEEVRKWRSHQEEHHCDHNTF